MRVFYSRFAFALSILCIALAVLSGCKKSSDEDGDYLTITPESISFQAEGGRRSVNVKSSSDWVAIPSADWLKVTVGSSGKAFSVEALQNPQEELRTGTVDVTSNSGQKATLTVTQTGISPTLSVNKTSVTLSADGEEVSVQVTSNIDWSIEQKSQWLGVDTDEDNLVLSASATPLFEERTDTVTLVPVLEQYAGKAVEIIVTQSAQVYAINISGDDMKNGEIISESKGDTFIVTVVANSDWTASSDAQWVVCKPSEGEKTDAVGTSVAVEVEENGEASVRNAVIVFECGEAKAELKISQRGAGVYMDLDNGDLQFADEAASVTVDVATNGNISFETTGNWVSATYQDGKITIGVEANSGDKRNATLTVKASAGDSSVEENIEIMQMGHAVNLSLNGTANCYVVNRAGTYKIKADVKGNGATTIGLERVEKSIDPNGAMIVWATDTTGCVGNVTLFDDYLYFETNGADGNAVIAATFDEYGLDPNEPPYRNILWSWHIWMTDFDIDDPVNQYEVGGDAKGLHSTFMGRNLGALSSGESGREDDILKSFGMQYQWGRKDPFPGAIEILFDPKDEILSSNNSASRSENAEIYYFQSVDATGAIECTKGQQWLHNAQVADESVAKNVQWTVEHPDYFMKSANTSYVWCTSASPETVRPLDESNPWGYLWGNPNTSINSIADKSIYDPCPVGWQVPSSGQWQFITSNGVDMIFCYGYNGRWKYNNVEARTATFKDVTAECRENNNNWSYIFNPNTVVIRMKDMKGGFNIFYTSCNEGETPEGGDRFDIQITTKEATGPTMFLPAAGVRNYFGELRRVGFGCHYWCSGIRSNDLAKNERLQANAVNLDYQGNLLFSFASDFNQLVCSRSVRCVKTDVSE